MNKDILIVIPAYNEGRVIGSVVRDIIKEGYKNILVINDASSDNTKSEAEKNGAEVISHVINRGGPGAPTMTGIIYARNKGYKKVVLMDADGQHSPSDIKKLLKYSNKFDFVIGSRMVSNFENMPFIRKFLNFGGSLVTWFFFGLFVRDSQSGFKVLNRKAIEKINLTYDTFEFCSEMIGEIYKHNLSYKEVPIKVIYTDHSQSKGQSLRNGFRMIWRLLLGN